MKNIFFLMFLILIRSTSDAQTWDLAKNIPYGAQNYGTSISTDSLQNIYVTGRSFYATGGSGSYNYFMFWKFDNSGNMLWADTLEMGSPKSVCEPNGDVYISGGNKIAKYNSSGNQLWLVTVPIAGLFLDIDIHPSGGVVVLGRAIFSDTSRSVFSRYDENGICLWTKINEFSRGGSNLKCDELGNTYIVGTDYPDSISGNRGFIVKYNNTGSILYSGIIPHTPNDITIDSYNNVFVTGWFSAYSINIFGNIYNASYPTNPEPQYLIKCNPSGNILWYKIITGQLGKAAIAADKNGNVYLTNSYTTLNMDSLNLNAPYTNSSNLFVMKADSLGNILWYRNSVANIAAASIYPGAIHVSDDEDVYIAGAMSKSHTFDSFTLTQASVYTDVLITKMSPTITTNTIKPAQIESEEFVIYPNPTQGTFQINYSSTEKCSLNLNIIDSKGQNIYRDAIQQVQGNFKKDIDLSKQAKGLYFIEVIADGKRSVKKIVLN